MVETVVAMVLLGVVVLAAVPFFISTLRSSAGLGVAQVAVTVASHQLEYIRSVPAQDLVSGRNAADVAALTADPGAVRLADDLLNTGNSDPGAGAGSSAAIVRLTDTQTLNGTVYLARNFINICYLSRTSGTCTRDASNGTAIFRVWVAVSWPRPPGVQCATGYQGRCEYVSGTLIDSSDEPIFSLKPAPVISALGKVVAGSTQAIGTLYPGELVTLKVTGLNFDPGATVSSTEGDTVMSVTGNTGTSLTVSMRISGTPGQRTLTVKNSDGASATAIYTVSVSPPKITVFAPMTTIRLPYTYTLTGTGFKATPAVTLSGTRTGYGVTGTIDPMMATSVTVVSSTSLTFSATMPWNNGLAYTAYLTVTVTNPDGGTTSSPFTVTVL